MDYSSYFILDAKDSTLVTRYKETRRSHPLAPTGLPLKGIEAERDLLTDMKARANIVLDTSDLKPKNYVKNCSLVLNRN